MRIWSEEGKIIFKSAQLFNRYVIFSTSLQQEVASATCNFCKSSSTLGQIKRINKATFENKEKRSINKTTFQEFGRYFYLCGIHRSVRKEANGLKLNNHPKSSLI